MPDKDIPDKFDCWAVLELFGHVRLAGHVTEATIGGCSFLRVDVPEREGDGIKFTRYFGNGAIYSMTPVSEEVARAVGDGNAAPPVTRWEMPRPALPPREEPPDSFEDQGDGDDDDEHPW
jgi:hypothetical protein